MRSGVAAETAGSYAPTHGQHPLIATLAEATTALSTAATLTIDDVDPDQLTGALDTVARLSRTLAAVQARVVRAVDRAQLARDQGATDTTALLKDRLKLSGRAAKRGVLGAPKLTEAQLLDTAKTTTPESFRDEVTRREHAADGDRLLRDERRAHARRSLRTWRTPDGLGAGTWTADPTNHDAIIVDDDTYLAAISDGEVTPDGDADPPAETGWAGPISTTALQRLCCDAQIVRIIASGPSQVIDVGRATREWNGSQRRAIVALTAAAASPAATDPPPGPTSTTCAGGAATEDPPTSPTARCSASTTTTSSTRAAGP